MQTIILRSNSSTNELKISSLTNSGCLRVFPHVRWPLNGECLFCHVFLFSRDICIYKRVDGKLYVDIDMWSSSTWPLDLTYSCPEHPKAAWQFWWNLSAKSRIWKLFEGEMIMRSLPTTLIEPFRKIIFNYKVILKSNINADDNVERESKVSMYQ